MQGDHRVHSKLADLGVREEAQVVELFETLRAEFDRELAELSPGASGPEAAGRTGDAAEPFRVRWLGRKQGLLTAANDNWLKPAAPALKRVVGRLLNDLKQHTEAAIEARRSQAAAGDPARLEAERLDVTLPGLRRAAGGRHPVEAAMDEVQEIFISLGYSVEVGPEIETDYYNFEAINIPPDHPARDAQDTFYVGGDPEHTLRPAAGHLEHTLQAAGDYLLRTHTSPVQIRAMERQQPPLRVIAQGKVYRRDNPDATHSFMFHQVEAIAVDTNITLADLKGTLDYFMKRFFGPHVRTRFRPSFFPFTEPSAEMDISCHVCDGRGCRVCKHSGWIELLGCGMVDPALYKFVNYDAARYSGFAFGCGVDRLAMMKYGINDLQLLFQGDLRLLRQFK